MIPRAVRLSLNVALGTAGLAAESTKTLAGDRALEISPRSMRRLLLTFDTSIQGQIPEILGDTHAERVDTLETLLRDASDEDMQSLLEALQEALGRRWTRRRRDRGPAPLTSAP